MKYKLSEIMDLIGGGTPKTSVPEYWGGDIPWLSVKDFNNDFRYVYKTEKTITEEGLKNSSTKMLYRDDSIISARGTVGEMAMIPFPMAFNQSCYGLRAKRNIVDPTFLYYLVKYNVRILQKNTHGSVFDTITRDTFSGIDIDIPPIDAQRKIAGILRDLDDKIELNMKLNENLQQQAFALFDQLMLESGDSKCLVSDVAYLNPKRQLSKNQVARCIDMSQLSTSGAFPSGWDMKPFNGGMRFINGDTLLARITPCLENGKTAYIDFLDKKEVAFGSTEYIVLAPREGVPPEYLYCLARYPAFVDYAVKNMNGSSGRQRVSADTIGKFVMNHPSEDALRNFGDIATALFMKMRYNSFENLRLVSLRDAILPRLMSGELDVSGLDL
nr:restriction endonuclease subunit S [Bacteroides intestinalis]